MGIHLYRGILSGNKLVFTSEAEQDAMFDFNLYERIHGEVNLIEMYQREHLEEGPEEQAVLSMMKAADASADRFVAYFRLHRSDGVPLMYANI